MSGREHVSGDRYVLYLPPAKTNIERLDNSLAQQIEGELRKFLTAWHPADVFSKSATETVSQVKKDRGVMRAFATWWDGGDTHILLVLAVYKKADEQSFWSDKHEYDRLAKEYLDELDERVEAGEIEEALTALKENADFELLEPE